MTKHNWNRLVSLVILSICFVFNANTAGAQELSETDIAEKYYNALYAGEFDVVRSVAAADMVFEDPTAPKHYEIPPRLETLEEFIELMKANLQGEETVTFSNKYASNGHVVLAVTITGTVPAETVGGTEGFVDFEVNGISVIHVKGGEVIRHTDYMDYAASGDAN